MNQRREELAGRVMVIDAGVIGFLVDHMPGMVFKDPLSLGISKGRLCISDGDKEPCFFQEAVEQDLIPLDILEEAYKAIPVMVEILMRPEDVPYALACIIDGMTIMIREQTKK